MKIGYINVLVYFRPPTRSTSILRVSSSDVVFKTDLGLKTVLRSFFEVLVLVLVLALDGLKALKNCGLKDQKSLKTLF